MMLWLFVLAFTDPVNSVQNGFLSLSESTTVGDAFSRYAWFETREWASKPIGSGAFQRVSFRGEIDDAKAVADYGDGNRYNWRANMKAMQLEPYYGLDDGKDRLAFVVRFDVGEDGSFAVVSGALEVRDAQGAWRRKALANKALVSFLQGVYLGRNPYLSLIEGLPFK